MGASFDYRSEVSGWDDAIVWFHVECRLAGTALAHFTTDAWLSNHIVRQHITCVNKGFSEMAGTKKKQEVQGADWAGYVNIRLTDEEMARYDAHIGKAGVVVGDSVAFLLEFGKLTINYTNGAFNATLTVAHGGKLYALSAFSDDWVDSVCLLAFKVTLYPDWVTMFGKTTTPKRG